MYGLYLVPILSMVSSICPSFYKMSFILYFVFWVLTLQPGVYFFARIVQQC